MTSAGLSSRRSAGPACSSARCASGCSTAAVDFAVHSLKDLPTWTESGLVLAAVPPPGRPAGRAGRRGTAPSWLICRRRARIGTGSPRRAAQLLLLRPDLRPGSDPWQRRNQARPGRPQASSMPSCSPTPGWPGSAGSTWSARCSSPRRCCRPRVRVRWPWSAWPAGPTWPSCWAQIDDPASRAATDAGDAACSPRCRRAARRRSARMLPGRMHCGWTRLSWRPTGERRCGRARRVRSARPSRLGRQVAAELLSRGAGRYTDVSAGHLSNGDDAK